MKISDGAERPVHQVDSCYFARQGRYIWLY
jgi:hypothetical protein